MAKDYQERLSLADLSNGCYSNDWIVQHDRVRENRDGFTILRV